MQQIKERGALPMIDRGDIRQAIDRCSNIWASLPGAGYGQFEQAADSLIAKFKEALERSRSMYMRVTAIISALAVCIIVCLSWAVNHYRDNAITYKAQRQKCQRTGRRTRQLLTCRCQRDVAALDAKYTKELADAKAENDALRDDVAAGRRRLHIKAVCQSVRKPPPPPAWIMQPPPSTGRHRWDYFTSERGRPLCKTTGRNL